MEQEYADAEERAYAIGLLPWEFERLSPRQLHLLEVASNDREQRLQDVLAWAVRHLLSPHGDRFHGKQVPSISALLGRPQVADRKAMKRTRRAEQQAESDTGDE